MKRSATIHDRSLCNQLSRTMRMLHPTKQGMDRCRGAGRVNLNGARSGIPFDLCSRHLLDGFFGHPLHRAMRDKAGCL